MKANSIIILVLINLLVFISVVNAQSDKKAVRQGNREYKKGEYLDSEISYRSALDINPSSFKANFNLGDALYKQEKYEEATQVFEDLSSLNIDSKDKAKVYHNLGNSYFKQQKYGESVNAYKNSLRHNPNDEKTKYNLAQAQRMLIQQEQQQDQSCDGDNEDKNDKKDDKKQDKDKQDEKKENEKQEQEDQKKQDEQEQQQQISEEDARRMLEAIQNKEQDIQDRIREEQAKQKKVKVQRNW
jgi:tetratricopeptide (TPR) repeat protein